MKKNCSFIECGWSWCWIPDRCAETFNMWKLVVQTFKER